MAVLTSDRGKQHAITLHLPEDLYATANEAVSLGLAPSQESFIEEAIRRRILEVRHARMRLLAAEAMADPGFVADMQDTLEDFRQVDQENWPEFDGKKANVQGAAV